MTLNIIEVTKLRNTLKQLVKIETYLKRHVIPKVPHKNINVSRLDPYAVQVSIICCFHEETMPSLRLYRKGADTGFTDWYCYGSCRTGGGLIELHKHAMLTLHNKRMTYVEAIESLADLYNVNHPDLYMDENSTQSVVRESGITLDDIMGQLTGIEPTKEEQPIAESYGMYLTLLEDKLNHIRRDSVDTYIHYVQELDYLMSLGIDTNELAFELKSLLDEIELAVESLKEEPCSDSSCTC